MLPVWSRWLDVTDAGMAKLPRAPDAGRLRASPPSIITVGPDLPLFRIYKRGGNHPTLWNQFRHYGPLSRFDHHEFNTAGEPDFQARGVLYSASDLATAVAEFFQHRRRRIDRFDENPWLASFRLPGDIRLLNLTDTFCVRVGASMKLMTGPFSHTQPWSHGFYETYPDIQGIYYQSSLTNRPAIMFYERADQHDLFPPTTQLHRPLDSPLMLKPLAIVAQEIGYRMI